MTFKAPPEIIPDDEFERMAAVRRYDVLDTPPDGAFDRITAIAARIFNVPIAIISIVDHDRIWFKSYHGVPVQQIDREAGLCASAILQDVPHILEDASKDVRSLANPLVAGDFGLRFYAGVPLHTHDGYNLGTLCVIDKEVRSITESQIADLRDLASLVMDQMELRLAARTELERASRANEQASIMGREIEHRVANSLQFVSSILRLQGRQVPEDVAAHFEMAAHRVGAVARVHRHLLDEENVAYVSALSYITRLSEDLAEILGVPVVVTGDDAQLTTKTTQSVGLLLNELVTNAAKHGSGKIVVSFSASNSDCKLSVCDEGKGLPPGFDFSAQKGLGMKIIDVLAKQLGGGVTIGSNNGKGTCSVVTFPRKSELAGTQ